MLGNLFEDRLEPYAGPVRCPKAGISCACDTHFQHDVVRGAEDSQVFSLEKRGYVPPQPVQAIKDRLAAANLSFSPATVAIGQTETAGFLALDTEVVKKAYQDSLPHLRPYQEEHYHPEFVRRQFPAKPEV